MVVTRPRRLASSTASTSKTKLIKSRRATGRTTNTIINVSNRDEHNDNNGEEEKEEEDSNKHGKRNSQTASRITKSTSISSEHTDNLIPEPHLPSEAKKDAPLTARGNRGTRGRFEKRGLAAKRKGTRSPGFFSDDEEVETPRLQYLESVVFPDYNHTGKGVDIFKEIAGRARRGQKDYKAIFDVPDGGLSSAVSTAASDEAVLENQSLQLSKTQAPERIDQEDDDDQNSLLFSRLSLTPPPMMFELEEGFESVETPWQMVFDSTHSSSSLDPQPRIKITELTLADLGHNEEHELPGEHMDDHEEQDDDPFGFTKAERRLERTKNSRPKLLAINEVNNRSFLAARAAAALKENSSSDTINNNRTGVLSNRLDRNVLERSAARKRGDVRNKGKAVDRGISTLTQSSNTDKTENDKVDESMDLDLQEAIQLSRGLDVVSGEGCSAVLGEQSPAAQGDADKSSIAAIRSSRRISRLYGRSTAVHESQDTQTAPMETNLLASNNSNAIDNTNGMDDIVLTEKPSTPQKPTTTNNNNDTTRSQQRDLNLSDSSDDLVPILVKSSPQTIPEAGVPSPPSASGTEKGGRPKKYMLTEQLEALLPRRRRPVGRLNVTGKRNSKRVVPQVTLSSESDIESESDNANASSAPPSSEEEEEEQLVRHRGHSRKKPVSTTSVPQSSSRKRRAPVNLNTPISKRSQASSKSKAAATTVTSSRSLKPRGKEKEEKEEDKSGWSPSQFAAQKERIKYFQQVDDFELEVETL
ncbi:hypothetical protein BGX27_003798 [Mortierella sp. AM989]|nr:hypothetical protein BGX27_003798 [Mortierella sp. AM989]